ncbi:MAG: hypothetical protein ABJN52_14700 [Litorimonas sp.]
MARKASAKDQSVAFGGQLAEHPHCILGQVDVVDQGGFDHVAKLFFDGCDPKSVLLGPTDV